MLFAALILAAAPASAAANECLALEVRSPLAPRERKAFSAARIRDLELATLLKRKLDGPHVLRLKVFTPRNHLYQVLTVPFTATPGPRGRARQRYVAGHTQPFVERQATAVVQRGARRYEVSAKLPVAGTMIMTNSLYGRWTVEPYLDGGVRPCGQAQSFLLTQ